MSFFGLQKLPKAFPLHSSREEALSELGGLDILVNSAGAARVILPSSAAIPDEEWIDMNAGDDANFFAKLGGSS